VEGQVLTARSVSAVVVRLVQVALQILVAAAVEEAVLMAGDGLVDQAFL
jgi:hypothetical protein